MPALPSVFQTGRPQRGNWLPATAEARKTLKVRSNHHAIPHTYAVTSHFCSVLNLRVRTVSVPKIGRVVSSEACIAGVPPPPSGLAGWLQTQARPMARLIHCHAEFRYGTLR